MKELQNYRRLQEETKCMKIWFINDQVVKANITKDTPLGSKGFFHNSKLEAVDAFGTKC